MNPNLIFLQGLKLLRLEHGVQTKDKRLVIDKFYWGGQNTFQLFRE